MKPTLILSVLLMLIIGLSAFNLKRVKVTSNTIKADSISADRKRYVDELRIAIKGKENMPADSVFKNIKVFKGVPAGRLLAIMNMGYSNSLGVTCSHCHDTQHWEAETKAAKDVARQMSAMTATINNQLLKNINGLQSANPVVNCTTCHRGAVKPALNMPMPAAN